LDKRGARLDPLKHREALIKSPTPDRGYLTVTPEYTIEVSRRIKEEFDNGREYYGLHGGQIQLPEGPARRPAAEFLKWHNDKVYQG